MKNKKLISLAVGVVLVLAGLFVIYTNSKKPYDTKPVENKPITTTFSEYTMTEVSTHNNELDCWTAIDSSVYNVTSWISQHPGGKKAIIGLCGIDGSSAFNGKHGGQARPASELANFKIGTIKK